MPQYWNVISERQNKKIREGLDKKPRRLQVSQQQFGSNDELKQRTSKEDKNMRELTQTYWKWSRYGHSLTRCSLQLTSKCVDLEQRTQWWDRSNAHGDYGGINKECINGEITT